MICNFRTVVIALVMLVLQTGCATNRSSLDPLEPFNRKIYSFNQGLDRVIVKPLTLSYQRHVPQPVRRGIGHFVGNLSEPTSALNHLLQGNPELATAGSLRFLINSTFGVVGLFDVATPLGLARHNEDFGQTLALWGIPEGPYLVLPLLGPSTARDTFGQLSQWALPDPLDIVSADTREVALSRYSMTLLHWRSQLLPLDALLAQQPDPYLFQYALYRQYRLDQIHDGSAPAEADILESEVLKD